MFGAAAAVNHAPERKADMTLNFQLLCFGLVAAGLVLSLVLNIVFGGFTVGKITRRLEVAVPQEQLPPYLARVNQRLGKLGFQADGATGAFIQRGEQVGVPTSHTHAKSPKLLELTVDESDPQQVQIGMSLRYLTLIVGDTGETAYADAVLNYVSNATDSMQLVANRSYMAFSSLVLGIWAWMAMIALKVFHIEPFTPTVLTLSITPIITSIMAIITIALKPRELSGMWLAIVGLVVSVLALGACVLLAALKAMG